jgi:hypothetical protein
MGMPEPEDPSGLWAKVKSLTIDQLWPPDDETIVYQLATVLADSAGLVDDHANAIAGAAARLPSAWPDIIGTRFVNSVVATLGIYRHIAEQIRKLADQVRIYGDQIVEAKISIIIEIAASAPLYFVLSRVPGGGRLANHVAHWVADKLTTVITGIVARTVAGLARVTIEIGKEGADGAINSALSQLGAMAVGARDKFDGGQVAYEGGVEAIGGALGEGLSAANKAARATGTRVARAATGDPDLELASLPNNMATRVATSAAQNGVTSPSASVIAENYNENPDALLDPGTYVDAIAERGLSSALVSVPRTIATDLAIQTNMERFGPVGYERDLMLNSGDGGGGDGGGGDGGDNVPASPPKGDGVGAGPSGSGATDPAGAGNPATENGAAPVGGQEQNPAAGEGTAPPAKADGGAPTGGGAPGGQDTSSNSPPGTAPAEGGPAGANAPSDGGPSRTVAPPVGEPDANQPNTTRGGSQNAGPADQGPAAQDPAALNESSDQQDTQSNPQDTQSNPQDTQSNPQDTQSNPQDTQSNPQDTQSDRQDTNRQEGGPPSTTPENTDPANKNAADTDQASTDPANAAPTTEQTGPAAPEAHDDGARVDDQHGGGVVVPIYGTPPAAQASRTPVRTSSGPPERGPEAEAGTPTEPTADSTTETITEPALANESATDESGTETSTKTSTKSGTETGTGTDDATPAVVEVGGVLAAAAASVAPSDPDRPPNGTGPRPRHTRVLRVVPTPGPVIEQDSDPAPPQDRVPVLAAAASRIPGFAARSFLPSLRRTTEQLIEKLIFEAAEIAGIDPGALHKRGDKYEIVQTQDDIVQLVVSVVHNKNGNPAEYKIINGVAYITVSPKLIASTPFFLRATAIKRALAHEIAEIQQVLLGNDRPDVLVDGSPDGATVTSAHEHGRQAEMVALDQDFRAAAGKSTVERVMRQTLLRRQMRLLAEEMRVHPSQEHAQQRRRLLLPQVVDILDEHLPLFAREAALPQLGDGPLPPLLPEGQSLGRFTMPAKGRLTRVGKVPAHQRLAELTRMRARQYWNAQRVETAKVFDDGKGTPKEKPGPLDVPSMWRPSPDINYRSKVHPRTGRVRLQMSDRIGGMIALVLDPLTGEVFEAANGPKNSEIAVEELHPQLRERAEAVLKKDGYPNLRNNNQPNGSGPARRDTPWSDLLLRHAEIRAVNMALHANPDLRISDLVIDVEFITPDGTRPASFCPNCAALLHDTTSNFGKRVYDPKTDKYVYVPGIFHVDEPHTGAAGKMPGFEAKANRMPREQQTIRMIEELLADEDGRKRLAEAAGFVDIGPNDDGGYRGVRKDGSWFDFWLQVGETKNGNPAELTVVDGKGYIRVAPTLLSSTTVWMRGVALKRALGHELSEINQKLLGNDNADLLTGKDPGEKTELSAHDHGRQTEMRILSDEYDDAKGPARALRRAALRHHMRLLAEELGVHPAQDNSQQLKSRLSTDVERIVDQHFPTGSRRSFHAYLHQEDHNLPSRAAEINRALFTGTPPGWFVAPVVAAAAPNLTASGVAAAVALAARVGFSLLGRWIAVRAQEADKQANEQRPEETDGPGTTAADEPYTGAARQMPGFEAKVNRAPKGGQTARMIEQLLGGRTGKRIAEAAGLVAIERNEEGGYTAIRKRRDDGKLDSFTLEIKVGNTDDGNPAELSIVDGKGFVRVSPTLISSTPMWMRSVALQRALGHEISEINQKLLGNDNDDLLTGKAPGERTETSAHDHGRQTEMRILADEYGKATGPARALRRMAMRQHMRLLAEEMGVHPAQDNSQQLKARLAADVERIVDNHFPVGSGRSWHAILGPQGDGLPTHKSFVVTALVTKTLPGIAVGVTIGAAIGNPVFGTTIALAALASGLGDGLLGRWYAVKAKEAAKELRTREAEQLAYENAVRVKDFLDQLLSSARGTAFADPADAPAEPAPRGERPTGIPALRYRIIRALPAVFGAAAATTMLPLSPQSAPAGTTPGAAPSQFDLTRSVVAMWITGLVLTASTPFLERWFQQRKIAAALTRFGQVKDPLSQQEAEFIAAAVNDLHMVMAWIDSIDGTRSQPPVVTPRPPAPPAEHGDGPGFGHFLVRSSRRALQSFVRSLVRYGGHLHDQHAVMAGSLGAGRGVLMWLIGALTDRLLYGKERALGDDRTRHELTVDQAFDQQLRHELIKELLSAVLPEIHSARMARLLGFDPSTTPVGKRTRLRLAEAGGTSPDARRARITAEYYAMLAEQAHRNAAEARGAAEQAKSAADAAGADPRHPLAQHAAALTARAHRATAAAENATARAVTAAADAGLPEPGSTGDGRHGQGDNRPVSAAKRRLLVNAANANAAAQRARITAEYTEIRAEQARRDAGHARLAADKAAEAAAAAEAATSPRSDKPVGVAEQRRRAQADNRARHYERRAANAERQAGVAVALATRAVEAAVAAAGKAGQSAADIDANTPLGAPMISSPPQTAPEPRAVPLAPPAEEAPPTVVERRTYLRYGAIMGTAGWAGVALMAHVINTLSVTPIVPGFLIAAFGAASVLGIGGWAARWKARMAASTAKDERRERKRTKLQKLDQDAQKPRLDYVMNLLRREIAAEGRAAAVPDPDTVFEPASPPSMTPTHIDASHPWFTQYVRTLVELERATLDQEPRPYLLFDARLRGLTRLADDLRTIDRLAERAEETGDRRPLDQAVRDLDDTWFFYQRLVSTTKPMPKPGLPAEEIAKERLKHPLELARRPKVPGVLLPSMADALAASEVTPGGRAFGPVDPDVGEREGYYTVQVEDAGPRGVLLGNRWFSISQFATMLWFDPNWRGQNLWIAGAGLTDEQLAQLGDELRVTARQGDEDGSSPATRGEEVGAEVDAVDTTATPAQRQPDEAPMPVPDPDGQSLGRYDESRLTRDADGRITHVDEVPVAEKLSELSGPRAQAYRALPLIGPDDVIALGIDPRTGEVFEATGETEAAARAALRARAGTDDLVVDNQSYDDTRPGPDLFSRKPEMSNAEVLASGEHLPLTEETVRAHAAAAEEDLTGVEVVMVTDPVELRYFDDEGAAACATMANGVPQIRLGPASFVDSDTLVATIAHERTHIRQFLDGRGNEDEQVLEDEAEASEAPAVERYHRNVGSPVHHRGDVRHPGSRRDPHHGPARERSGPGRDGPARRTHGPGGARTGRGVPDPAPGGHRPADPADRQEGPGDARRGRGADQSGVSRTLFRRIGPPSGNPASGGQSAHVVRPVPRSGFALDPGVKPDWYGVLRHARAAMTRIVADVVGVLDVRPLDDIGNFEMTRDDNARSVFKARVVVEETRDGAPAEVEVTGPDRGVIRVSPYAGKDIVDRAVASALAQLGARLAGNDKGRDLLDRGRHPGDSATPSAHDVGRETELAHLVRTRAEAARYRVLRRRRLAAEMRALVEDMGVHPNEEAGPQRRAVVSPGTRDLLDKHVGPDARRPSWVHEPSGYTPWKAFIPAFGASVIPGLSATGMITALAIIGDESLLVPAAVGVMNLGTAVAGTLVARWYGRREKDLVDAGHGYFGKVRAHEVAVKRRALMNPLLARMRTLGIDVTEPGPPEPAPTDKEPARLQPYKATLVSRALPPLVGAIGATALLPLGLPFWNLMAHWGIAGFAGLFGPTAERYFRARMVMREWKWFDAIGRELDRENARFDEEFAKKLHALMDRIDRIAGITSANVAPVREPIADTTVAKDAANRYGANSAPNNAGDFSRDATNAPSRMGNAVQDAVSATGSAALDAVGTGLTRFGLGVLVAAFMDRKFTRDEYAKIVAQVRFDFGATMVEQAAQQERALLAMLAEVESRVEAAEAAAHGQSSQAAQPRAVVPLPPNPAARPPGHRDRRQFRLQGLLQGAALWGIASAAAAMFRQGMGPVYVVGAAAAGVVASFPLRFMHRRAEQQAVDRKIFADRAKDKVVEAAESMAVRGFMQELINREVTAAERARAAGLGPVAPDPVPAKPNVPATLDSSDPAYPDHIEALANHERELLLRDPRPLSTLGARLVALQRLDRLAARTRLLGRHESRTGNSAPARQARIDLAKTWAAYQKLVADGTAMPYDHELYLATKHQVAEQLRSYLDQSTPIPGGRMFFAPGDPLLTDRLGVREVDGVYTIDAHGVEHGPDGVGIRVGAHLLTVEHLSAILDADPNYDGGPIRLLVCESGRGADSFAQRLADRRGQPVTAPTKYYGVDDNGTEFVTDVEVDANGVIRPKFPPTGEMRTFEPRKNNVAHLNPDIVEAPIYVGAGALDRNNPWRLRGGARPDGRRTPGGREYYSARHAESRAAAQRTGRVPGYHVVNAVAVPEGVWLEDTLVTLREFAEVIRRDPDWRGQPVLFADFLTGLTTEQRDELENLLGVRVKSDNTAVADAMAASREVPGGRSFLGEEFTRDKWLVQPDPAVHTIYASSEQHSLVVHSHYLDMTQSAKMIMQDPALAGRPVRIVGPGTLTPASLQLLANKLGVPVHRTSLGQTVRVYAPKRKAADRTDARLAAAVDRDIDLNAITPEPVWRKFRRNLYRMEDRAPDEIFREGFAPRHPDEVDLTGYVRKSDASAFVSTSANRRLHWNPNWGNRKYRYTIDAPGGIHVSRTLPDGLRKHWPEKEIAFPGGIDARFIRGAHRMKDNGSLGEWTANPNYDPKSPAVVRPSETVTGSLVERYLRARTTSPAENQDGSGPEWLGAFFEISEAYEGGRAFFAHDDPIRQDPDRVLPRETGWYVVDFHSLDGVPRIGNHLLDADQIVWLITQDPNWQGQNILLPGCHLGRGDNSLAQRIADATGVDVKAAPEWGGVDDDGNVFSTGREVDANGMPPIFPPTSEMRVFSPRPGRTARPLPANPAPPPYVDLTGREVDNPWGLRGGGTYQPSEWEQALAGRKIVALKLLRSEEADNENETFAAVLDDGTRWVFKPTLGEQHDLREHITGNLGRREVAASRVNEALGFPLVPRTTMIEDNWTNPGPVTHPPGSLQMFVENAREGGNATDFPVPQQQMMAVLDYIIGNTDRHPGNYLTGPGGDLIAIDHGLAFPSRPGDAIKSDFIALHLGRRLLPEVVDAVRAVRLDVMRATLLDSGLDDAAVDLTIARLREVRVSRRITGKAWPGKIVNGKRETQPKGYDRDRADTDPGGALRPGHRPTEADRDLPLRGEDRSDAGASRPGLGSPRTEVLPGRGEPARGEADGAPERGPGLHAGTAEAAEHELLHAPGREPGVAAVLAEIEAASVRYPGGRVFHLPGDPMPAPAAFVPPDPGRYTVDLRGVAELGLTPDHVAAILLGDQGWTGQPIRLLTDDDGFAQHLANLLQVPVTTPADTFAPRIPQQGPPTLRLARIEHVDPPRRITEVPGPPGASVFRAHLDDGTRAIYKPEVYTSSHQMHAEVAAYRVSELFGFGLVPTTTVAEDDGSLGPGSLQRFAENASEGQPTYRYTALETQRMAVLDYLIGNLDRHMGNYLTGPDGELIAIDHGLAFPEHAGNAIMSDFVRDHLGALPDPEVAQAIAEVARAVSEVAPAELRTVLLSTGLSPTAVDLAVARLVEIQEHGRITGEAWAGTFIDSAWREIQKNQPLPPPLPPAAADPVEELLQGLLDDSVAYEGGRALFAPGDPLRDPAHRVPKHPDAYTVEARSAHGEVRVDTRLLDVEHVAWLVEADSRWNWEGQQPVRLVANVNDEFTRRLADRLGVEVYVTTRDDETGELGRTRACVPWHRPPVPDRLEPPRQIHVNEPVFDRGDGDTHQPSGFPNQQPERLDDELAVMQRNGVAPTVPGTPEFDAMISSGDGRLKWVVMADGEFRVAPHDVDQDEISHAAIAGGGAVRAAGTANVAGSSEAGYFGLDIDNHSGHYFHDVAHDADAVVQDGVAAFGRYGVPDNFERNPIRGPG